MNETNMENEKPESDGIDGIIATVESYIQNPKMVTPETLNQLKSDLMDLKDYLDNGENQEESGGNTPFNEGHGGLAIMIGRAKGGR